MACLAVLVWSLLPASAQAQTPRVLAKPEPVYRYLIVLDASFSMGPRSINLRNSVFDMVQSGFRGHIRPGEPFGLWTFNETVQIADFPRLHWDPLLRDALARQSYEFLGSLRFHKQTRLDRAMRQIANLARDADDLVILLYTDGQAEVSGTPFDAAINQVFAQRNPELRKERSPFLTALRVRQGQFVAHTVGASYDPVDIRPLLPDETAPPKPPTSDILIIRNENPAPTPPPTPPPTPAVVPAPVVARNDPKPAPPSPPPAAQPPLNPTPRLPATPPTNPPPPPAVNSITLAPSPTAPGTQPSPSTPPAPTAVAPAASPQPSPPPLSATPPRKPSDVPDTTAATTAIALPPTLPPPAPAPASPPPVQSTTAPPVTPTLPPVVQAQNTSSSAAPANATTLPQTAVVDPRVSSPPPASPAPAPQTPTASKLSPAVPTPPPTPSPSPVVAQANPLAPPSHLPLPIPERKPATLPGAGPLVNPTNAVALAVGNPAGGGRGMLIALGAVLLLGAGTALVLMLRANRSARSPSLISQSLDRDQH